METAEGVPDNYRDPEEVSEVQEDDCGEKGEHN